MRSLLILFLSLLFLNSSYGQDEHEEATYDTVVNRTISDVFRHGHLHGHIRNMYMHTINDGELQDYWANATGGALRYETGIYKNFSAGVKGIFTYNTFSSDLNKKDPITGKSAAWEKELYDYTRPEEKKDLDRLEELYISYHHKRSVVSYGKIDINEGPLFLRRDGRMKPFVFRGLWSQIHEWEHHDIYAGWINGVSPRGITEWYPINEAIGINNNGYEPDGSKSHYHETAETKGIGILGWNGEIKEHIDFKIWNFYFHNMMYTLWLQMDGHYKDFYGGAQYVYQHPVGNQYDLEYNSRYMQPDEEANVVSFKTGYKKGQFDFSLAYLHAFDTGRFLFPRELGREDFYVSQPRSYIDGFGDLDVYMVRVGYNPEFIPGAHIDLRLSRTQTTGTTGYEFNKYGLASFDQINAIINYKMHGSLKGLNLKLWYISMFDTAGEIIPIENKAYKYDYHHFAFATNIEF